ncbi:MAG: dephospho-CoA kinase [Kofleriaceae bacterium]|nr:dephospho-CoA kinase [Kofleriaceae bacterium]
MIGGAGVNRLLPRRQLGGVTRAARVGADPRSRAGVRPRRGRRDERDERDGDDEPGGGRHAGQPTPSRVASWYARDVPTVIGLTGGIASGKSAVAAMLRERGAAVVDADLVARQVVEPGQPALDDIRARFGDDVLAADGTLDRKKLGERVFADPAARADLNAITHPRIALASQSEIAAWQARGAHVVFYEAALLVENGAHRGLDALIVVAVPPDVQVARLRDRDGLDEAAARARLASQLPLDAKLKHATWVIDNGGDLAATRQQVAQVCAAIEDRFGPVAVPGAGGRRSSETGPLPVPEERVLVTGYPAFTARRMIARALAADQRARVIVLARAKFAAEAEAYVRGLPGGDRAEVVVGDVCDMDLGLSATEYQQLTAKVTTIHHLAGIYYMGVDAATTRRVNVTGTRGVVELARDCGRLRRLIHWSTAQVSGRRKGVILEEELDEGQGFHNVYEETKFEAEQVAREAMRQLPITVLRPGVIVGDSRTGEIDKFDGPYYLMVLIATNATQVHLPLPGRGTAPMHVVPIDYVIDAGWALGNDPRAAGRTFHLTDAHPLPARRVYELVAEHSQTASPRGYIPGRLVKNVLRTPGIGRLARGPLSFLDSFDHQVFYNGRGAQELLAGTSITCPAFDSYVEHLVRYVREVHAQKKGRGPDDDVFDPFE